MCTSVPPASTSGTGTNWWSMRRTVWTARRLMCSGRGGRRARAGAGRRTGRCRCARSGRRLREPELIPVSGSSLAREEIANMRGSGARHRAVGASLRHHWAPAVAVRVRPSSSFSFDSPHSLTHKELSMRSNTNIREVILRGLLEVSPTSGSVMLLTTNYR